MAKLSAKGRKEIGRIELLTSTLSYMDNGDVLVNKGFGWKVKGKVKEGILPAEAYANKLAKVNTKNNEFPLFNNYRKALHNIAGMGTRWKLHSAISLMPNDPDGVWSEACDGYGDNCHADIDEISELCRLYKLAIAEAKVGESI